jgi:hypothetical protein
VSAVIAFSELAMDKKAKSPGSMFLRTDGSFWSQSHQLLANIIPQPESSHVIVRQIFSI